MIARSAAWAATLLFPVLGALIVSSGTADSGGGAAEPPAMSIERILAPGVVRADPPAAPGVLEAYRAMPFNHRDLLQQYTPDSDYLNLSRFKTYKDDPSMQFDARGLPMAWYRDGFYYNPVTLAQFALTEHGHHVSGTGALEPFLVAAEFLASWADESGALRYPFAYHSHLTGTDWPPGWTSGMAQGQALSVFARAYALTGERRYVEAGERALAFLITPEEEGGPLTTLSDLAPELEHLVFFQEFPYEPDAYTLNGFMFTMLGLLDWSTAVPASVSPSSATARAHFDDALWALLVILPSYDLGYFSTYDLGHRVYGAEPNLQPWYHAIHIGLLHVLHSATGIEGLEDFERTWTAYVER